MSEPITLRMMISPSRKLSRDKIKYELDIAEAINFGAALFATCHKMPYEEAEAVMELLKKVTQQLGLLPSDWLKMTDTELEKNFNARENLQ
jgi:hypothetical protein